MSQVSTPIRPMKAVVGELPVGDDWVYEIKWDGMRVLAHLDDSTLLRSGNEIDVTDRFPELAELHVAVGDRTAILDGEVVALDDDGRPSFSALQRRMHVADRAEAARRSADVPVAYQVFDLLHFDRHDLTRLPLADRRRLLEELIDGGPAWRVTEQFDDGAALLAHAAEHRLEGIVAKRLDSRYDVGARSRSWRKVKIRREQDFVVAGTSAGAGGRAGSFGSLLLGYWVDGRMRYAGRVGTGFSDVELTRLAQLLAPMVVDTDPFDPPLSGVEAREVTFVRPEVVVQVGYAEWSRDGRLRHPTYLGQRHDVDAADVGVEP
ncbi:MAG: non-homologous end-joining DNA ligase [Acidimicrobiia bacterium]|nr:non-homologous end-joining DNA ligase [Acidimicrobiia bacterium]